VIACDDGCCRLDMRDELIQACLLVKTRGGLEILGVDQGDVDLLRILHREHGLLLQVHMAVIQLLECRPLDGLVLLLEVRAARPAYLGRYGVVHVQRHKLKARDIDVLRLT